MSRDVIKFPIISGSLITFYLLFGAIVNKVILPKSAIGSDVPNRTASFINATMAPGLSSFTFINEFGGPGAAGIGSLMDVSARSLFAPQPSPSLAFRPLDGMWYLGGGGGRAIAECGAGCVCTAARWQLTDRESCVSRCAFF